MGFIEMETPGNKLYSIIYNRLFLIELKHKENIHDIHGKLIGKRVLSDKEAEECAERASVNATELLIMLKESTNFIR